MLTDAQLFHAWGGRCSGKSATVSLYGNGKVTVHPAIVPAVLALNVCLIVFNYATRAADTGAYVCRPKVGSKGWSAHAYKLALDLNWATNPFGPLLRTDMPPAMRAAIKAIRTNNGKQVWAWGGDWSGNKDAMHWQICCTPADLATGIDPRTLPGGAAPAPAPTPIPTPVPFPPAQSEEDDMLIFVSVNEDPQQPGDMPKGAVVRLTDTTWQWLAPETWNAERDLAVIQRRFDGSPQTVTQAQIRAYTQCRINVTKLNAAASL